MILEQEIKLEVNEKGPIDLSLLSCLSDFGNGVVSKHRLVSTYYDTKDLHLSHNRLGLRLRQIDERYFQTVKTLGTVSNGLHQREEWEYELEGAEWDFSTLKLTPLASMIDDVEIWSKLSPIFTTDFVREIVLLTLSEGSQVELAYDRGEVRTGELHADIHEIELELKSGSCDQLYVIADLLRQQLDLTLSDVSKAQMGYELAAKKR